MPQVTAYKVDTLVGVKPDAIVALKVQNENKFELYVTSRTGVAFPLKEALPSSAIIKIKNTDENLTISGTTTVTINISNALLATINSALQAGDNISDLVNDAGYITIADVPIFIPNDYDLEDFTNTGLDPFAHQSEITFGITNLSYTQSPTNGIVTSDTGTGATIPLADLTNAGLLSSSEKVSIDSIQNLDIRIDILESLQNLNTNVVGTAYAIWTGVGLTYDVIYPNYYIEGVLFTGATVQRTLAVADPTNPRQDVFALDVTGVIVKTGDATPDPVAPSINTQIEIYITTVFIGAGATTPVIIEENIYKENIEWTTVSNNGTVNFNAVATPFQGTKHIDCGLFTAGQYLRFTDDALNQITDFNNLKFYLNLKATFNTTTKLSVRFYNGATSVSSTVIINSGTYNFVRTIVNSYQTINIPLTAFTFSSSSFDRIEITTLGFNASGFKLDNIILFQGDVSVSPLQKSIVSIVTDSGIVNATVNDDTITIQGTGKSNVSASGKTITINTSSEVSQTIIDGVTTTAPSENAVFDALALKANTSSLGNFIPLTGTTVGNPVSGIIEIAPVTDLFIQDYAQENGLFAGVNGSGVFSTNTIGHVKSILLNNGDNGILVTGTNPLSKGLVGMQNFTPNITDLDYTQKIYVDTKAPLDSPTFTGSVVVPNATLSTQVVNKSQLDAVSSAVKVPNTYFINSATGNNATGVYEDSSKPFLTFDYINANFTIQLNDVFYLEGTGLSYPINSQFQAVSQSFIADANSTNTVDFSSNANSSAMLAGGSLKNNISINLPNGRVRNERSGGTGIVFNAYIANCGINFNVREVYWNASTFLSSASDTQDCFFKAKYISARNKLLQTLQNDIEIETFNCLGVNTYLTENLKAGLKIRINNIIGVGNFVFGIYDTSWVVGNISTTGVTSILNGITTNVHFDNSIITGGGLNIGNGADPIGNITLSGNINSISNFTTGFGTGSIKLKNFVANLGANYFTASGGAVIFENCSITTTNSLFDGSINFEYGVSTILAKNSVFERTTTGVLLTSPVTANTGTCLVTFEGVSHNATMISNEEGTTVTVNVIGKQPVANGVAPKDAVNKSQLDAVSIANMQYPVQAQKTTSYTFILSDANTYIPCTLANSTIFTVPTNASVPFPIGTRIGYIFKSGMGNLTISGAGVTFYGNTQFLLEGDSGYIIKTDTNTWSIEGIIVKNPVFKSTVESEGTQRAFWSKNNGSFVFPDGASGMQYDGSNVVFRNFGAGYRFQREYNYNNVGSVVYETIWANPTINPTSGSTSHNFINYYPTINQTGGANGITRGLYINPTLTSAFDFRAIEVTAGKVIIPKGTESNQAVNLSQVPIQLKDFYADVNNVSTTETDLLTYTTLANRLNATGEKIIATYGGTLNDVTASSQLKAYFAGTNIADTGALTMSVTGAWVINISIIRTGVTTARAMVNISTPGASTASYTKYTALTGLTFTATNIIKITGTAGGATGDNDDITATYGNIQWQPAAL